MPGNLRWLNCVCGRGLFVGVLTLVGVSAVVASSASMAAARGASSEAARPTPAHLIVGKSIVLPAALYTANAPGSPSLITPSGAAAAAKAMWEQWEQALVSSNTRALSQLAVAGSLLSGTIDECALPKGRCVFETVPPPILQLNTIVPLQTEYPLYFLSEILTMRDIDAANGLPVKQAWTELQILTKGSEQAPWRLAFDSGYNLANGATPSMLPFDLAAIGPTGQPGPRELYNPPPKQTPPAPPEQFLPLLAAYWQSFRNTGRAPTATLFVSDGYTSGVGKQFAQRRQGSIYAGHRDTFRFSAAPALGTWQFSAVGGYPLLCGTIRDLETSVPVKGLLVQNADESNYGVPLRTGEYRRIVTTGDHETCVYVKPTGLDAVGNTSYLSNVTGTRVKNAPGVRNAALADVETAYSVLAYEIHQYQTQLRGCLRTHAPLACSSLYATRAEHELARFARRLGTANLPGRAQAQVERLAATARALTKLFEQLANKRPTPMLFREIDTVFAALNRQYHTLIATAS